MFEKSDWLVQVPIHENDLAAWKSNREAHVAHLKAYVIDGTILFAGPTLESHPKSPGDEIKVQSSVMVFRAATEEDVRGIVEKNPFVGVGVWDMKQVVVAPFLWGVGRPTV